MKSYIIRISLKYSNPLIWREVMIPEKISFNRLHNTIQMAMGWYDYHLHEFYFKKENLFITNNIEELGETESFMLFEKGPKQTYKDSEKVKIDKYITKYPKFSYLYDFGDGWEHEIELLREVEGVMKNSPTLIDGEGDCPPEDCGGIHGYEEFLEVIKNPEDPEYKEMKAWAKSNGFKKFNLKDINEDMTHFLVLKRIKQQ